MVISISSPYKLAETSHGQRKKHINWKAHESSIYFLPKINLEFAGIILLAEVFS
jgi:hypothetical protein